MRCDRQRIRLESLIRNRTSNALGDKNGGLNIEAYKSASAISHIRLVETLGLVKARNSENGKDAIILVKDSWHTASTLLLGKAKPG